MNLLKNMKILFTILLVFFILGKTNVYSSASPEGKEELGDILAGVGTPRTPSQDSFPDDDRTGARADSPNSIDVAFLYESDASADSETEGATFSEYISETENSLNDAETRKMVEELNQRLAHETGAERDFPHLYIAHYRGLTYLRDRFVRPHERRMHYRTSHARRTTYSPAVYDKSHVSYGTPEPQEKQVESSVEDITDKFEQLSVTTPVPTYWKTSTKRLFSSPLHRHHQRASNTYDAYHKEAVGRDQEELGHFDSPESPYVAAADGPYHALRYAFGLKLPECQRPFAFRPDYDQRTGYPRHHHMGKVLIFVHSLPEYLQEEAAHVPTLCALAEISAQTRSLDESETTFRTFVRGKYIVFEEIARVPSLAEYRSHYQRRYGLTKRLFNNRRKAILEARDEKEKKAAEEELCDRIAEYQARRLLRRAKEYVEARKGKLVYKKVPDGYDVTPPDLHLARKLHKENFETKQKEIKTLQSLQREPQTLAESPLPRRQLFSVQEEEKIHFYSDEPRLYFSVDEHIDTLLARLSSHRNNRFIRRFLIRDMRADWGDFQKVIHEEEKLEPTDDFLLKRTTFKRYLRNFSQWHRGLSGTGMIEALTYLWRLDRQTPFHIWTEGLTPHCLQQDHVIGPERSQDTLHVLKVTSHARTLDYLLLQLLHSTTPLESLSFEDSQGPSRLHPTAETEEEAFESISLQEAEEKGAIGPRSIEGWDLHDVEDLGNCFYEAVGDQLQLSNHAYLQSIPETTLLRDSLRLRVQGDTFRDREWADNETIDEFVKRFPDCILAVVDTRYPERGFTCYFFDGEIVRAYMPDATGALPLGRHILRIAFTGNHFLSVRAHPALEHGLVQEVFKF